MLCFAFQKRSALRFKFRLLCLCVDDRIEKVEFIPKQPMGLDVSGVLNEIQEFPVDTLIFSPSPFRVLGCSPAPESFLFSNKLDDFMHVDSFIGKHFSSRLLIIVGEFLKSRNDGLSWMMEKSLDHWAV